LVLNIVQYVHFHYEFVANHNYDDNNYNNNNNNNFENVKYGKQI